MRIVLSSQQYTMLKELANEGKFDEGRAGELNQTAFRSMLYQQWVVWDGSFFRVSPTGKDAIRNFEHGDILRKVASLKLTSYFQNLRRRRR